MTAYGAVISLKNTIDIILYSSHFCFVGGSRQIIRVAYKDLQPLQEILERLDSTSPSRSRKKVNALDGIIKDLIWEFEDSLESLLTHQILSQIPAGQIDEEMTERVWKFQPLLESITSQPFLSQSHAPEQVELHKHKGKSHASQSKNRDVLLFSIDLQLLQDDVASFIKKLKDLEKEYIYEVGNMAEDDEAASSTIGFVGTNEKMIGLSDQFKRLKRDLVLSAWSYIYPLVGMAGVGKTTLAKKIYQDAEIQSKYECRAWVTVGRKPQPSQISRGILAQLCGITLIEADDIIDDYQILKQRLEGKKCLIVLDDVWETQIFNSLCSFLPDPKNGRIIILLTARDESFVEYNTSTMECHCTMVVRFLNEEESKNLLCEKVFGEEICPPQLDKAATKIAKNCEGLPLMIVTVADILSKSERNRDPDYWDDVAEERNSVFMDAYNKISKVLFPSYDYLLQYLKMPFLFLGVFPREYDTPPYKIINMFTAEGWFLHTNAKEFFEKSVWDFLSRLCGDKNLVLFKYMSMYVNQRRALSSHKYKTCRLHSSWRHVCRGEARKNKFYQVLNKLVDAEEESVKGQRCLCLENNILFGIKEFCNSVRLNSAPTARSILFFGPYHQYPTPIDVGFKLLRELDALQLRFYTFPTEILALVQLKYLALTCNGEVPATISKLFNLRVLIIHPHMNIRCCRAPSYVPVQIWDMKELEHIEILGKSLVAPSHIVSLEKLLALVGVNASICTILRLSRRIPNIRKLVVQIELTPYDDHNDILNCFGRISALESLETLKYSIMNPVAKSRYVVPKTPSSLMLPRGLKKLHLSGMSFPWQYMDVVGSLPYLQVLKLRSYAFRGPMWEAQEGSFSNLKFLLIEDTDLVYLNMGSKAFCRLNYVSMKHCYKLGQIRWPTHGDIKIELVDCNPLALTCANQLKLPRFSTLDLTASSSFHEKPVTINVQRFYDGDKYLTY